MENLCQKMKISANL